MVVGKMTLVEQMNDYLKQVVSATIHSFKWHSQKKVEGGVVLEPVNFTIKGEGMKKILKIDVTARQGVTHDEIRKNIINHLQSDIEDINLNSFEVTPHDSYYFGVKSHHKFSTEFTLFDSQGLKNYTAEVCRENNTTVDGLKDEIKALKWKIAADPYGCVSSPQYDHMKSFYENYKDIEEENRVLTEENKRLTEQFNRIIDIMNGGKSHERY